MTDSIACRLCDARAFPTLRDRPDCEYGISVQLDYWRCTGCGLVFADPIPSEMIPSFYAAYSTHERADIAPRNSLWNVIDAITPALDRTGSFISLEIPQTARILDFGCGDGVFLDELRQDGFTDLAGCDFDQNVAAATMPGLRFFAGIDQLAGQTFDIITLNHVLEHVEDVKTTFRRLRTHLNPGGFIYVRTPNARSILAKVFRGNWRGWETPRHLNVLTPEAVRQAVHDTGGEVGLLVTSNDMRAGMMIGSMGIAFRRLPEKIRNVVGSAAYIPTAWLLKTTRAIAPLSGEEIVAIIR